MLDLSIIIVSYNAVDFLKICMQSVYAACNSINAEVFVVDNNSSDFSAEMIRKDFPNCHLIANKHNPGFSVANNQAIKLAKGRYILILNPDTIVAEDTFSKMISFLDSNSKIGSLGIKMIDGSGNFLPESKRGIPTPWTALCKVSGLSSIFKKSKLFNEYHKGYIPENKNHEIEILAGAFMCLRKTAVEKAGMFDESFFMYGEDIDLSYRLIQSGYKNYYFAESTIIHFKGESTNKDKIYRDRFYKAMVQFAKKHYSKSYGFLFNILITTGIGIVKYLSSGKSKKNDEILNESDNNFLLSNSQQIQYHLPHNLIPVSPNGINKIEQGTLIFSVKDFPFCQLIQIMEEYGSKFKYRFLFDSYKIMIGSDKKDSKGQVQHL